MRFQEPTQAIEQASTPVAIKDRRRPGRNDQVSSHLIPLLRNPEAASIPAPSPGEVGTLPLGGDDLAPARGIIVGLMVSVPLWAGIVGIMRVALR